MKNAISHAFITDIVYKEFEKVAKPFFVKFNFNWESSYLIFVVICAGCQEEYIGQANTVLKERVSVYKQYIHHSQYQMLKVSPREVYEDYCSE